jgi:hypothetical protein
MVTVTALARSVHKLEATIARAHAVRDGLDRAIRQGHALLAGNFAARVRRWGRAPLAGGSGDDAATIREVRTRMRAGTLPVVYGLVNARPARGRACAICDKPTTHVEYEALEALDRWVHSDCYAIWLVESGAAFERAPAAQPRWDPGAEPPLPAAAS